MKKSILSFVILNAIALNANASNVDVNHFLRTADMAANHNATALANIKQEYKGLNTRDRMFVDGIADLTPMGNIIKETAAQVTSTTDMAKGWDAKKTEVQVTEAHIYSDALKNGMAVELDQKAAPKAPKAPTTAASNADVNHFLRTADMAAHHNATALATIKQEYQGLNSRDRLFVDGIANLTSSENIIKETAAQVKSSTDMAAGWDATKTEQQVREAHQNVDALKAQGAQARANEANAHDNRGYAQAAVQSKQMAKLLADPDMNPTPVVLAGQEKAPVAAHVPTTSAAGVTGSGNGAAPTTMTSTAIIQSIDKRVDGQATIQKGTDTAQDKLIAGKADTAALQKTQRDLSNLQVVSDEAHQTAYDNKAAVATLKTDVAAKADQTALDTVKTQLNNQVVNVENKLKTKADTAALTSETTRATGEEKRIEGLAAAAQRAGDTAFGHATDVGTELKKEEADRAAADTKLQASVDTKAAKSDVTALTTKVDTNTQALTKKADTATLDALQKRVTLDEQYDGDAISKNRDGVDANKAAVAANKTAIDTNATGVKANTAGVAANKAAVATNAQSIQANTTALTAKADQATVDAVQKVAAANTTSIATAQQTEAKHFTALQTGVKANSAAVVDLQSRSADLDQRIAAQKVEQSKTNAKVAQHSAELADHESRIQTLEGNTSANFGKLKSQVEANRKRASAGIAGVAAQANIPQVLESQTFSVGAGVGNTDGESALAVGFSARASESVVVKAAVSNDTQHNFVVGAGVSYGW